MEVEKSEKNERTEEQKRTEAVDEAVKNFAGKKEFSEALKFMRLGASKKAIDYAIKCALEAGDDYYAERIAEARGEGISEKEIDPIIKIHIAQGDLDKAETIAHLGASLLARDSIVRAWLAQPKEPYEFLKKALKLKPSRWVKDFLMRGYCAKGKVKEATLVAHSQGRNLIEEEISTLMEAIIRKGHFGLIEETRNLRPEGSFTEDEKKQLKEQLIARGRIGLIKEWEVDLKQDEIDLVVMKCIERNDLEGALEAAQQGASAGVVNKLVIACCGKGDYERAKKSVILLKRGFKIAELNLLIRVKCQEGRLREAEEAAQERGKLDEDEIKAALEAIIEDCNLQLAIQAAGLMERDISVEELDALLEQVMSRDELPYSYWSLIQECIKRGASSQAVDKAIRWLCTRGETDKVIESIKLCGRGPSNDEIDALASALKERKETYKITDLLTEFAEALTTEQIGIIRNAIDRV